jgi:hypothetical protein
VSQVGSRHHRHRPLPDDLRPGHGPQPRQFGLHLLLDGIGALIKTDRDR